MPFEPFSAPPSIVMLSENIASATTKRLTAVPKIETHGGARMEHAVECLACGVRDVMEFGPSGYGTDCRRQGMRRYCSPLVRLRWRTDTAASLPQPHSRGSSQPNSLGRRADRPLPLGPTRSRRPTPGEPVQQRTRHGHALTSFARALPSTDTPKRLRPAWMPRRAAIADAEPKRAGICTKQAVRLSNIFFANNRVFGQNGREPKRGVTSVFT